MSSAASIFRAGAGVLAATVGKLTGTIVQGGTSLAFTGAWLNGVGRTPRGGQSDLLERELTIPHGAISEEPLAGSRLTFTGDATAWLVASVAPFAPGGVVASWTLNITDWTDRPL